MINQLFVATVSYQEPIEGEDGTKQTKQNYLVSAVSVSDVEVKMLKFLPDNLTDKMVISASPSAISETFDIDDEKMYSWILKVGEPIEKKSGKGMKTVIKYRNAITTADSPEEALKKAKENFSGLVEYAFDGVTKSKMVCDRDLL